MIILYPCPVCGEPGRYRSWEPFVGTDEHGEYHSTREVCLVCAKRGPRWLRLMWCWLDDQTQRPRKVLVAFAILIFMLAYMLGTLAGVLTTR